MTRTPTDPSLTGPTPEGIPLWLWYAVHDLYDDRERIDGEAMNDAQIAHDPEAGRYTWCRMVARLIRLHQIAAVKIDHLIERTIPQ